ncbi:MAG: LuxR family transcriptional regulator [Aquimonas sp.]|nr:LuxR family transcriptional regulator [Aquimonas sp.]
MALAMEVLQGLAGMAGSQALSARIDRVCASIGIDHWLYAVNLPLLNDRYQQFTLGSYPETWVKRYIERDYLKIDPVVAHCHDHSTPLLWSEVRARAERAIDPLQISVRRMFDEASDAGLAVGLSVPLHGPGQCWGLMSFASRERAGDALSGRVAELHLLAHFVHEAARPFARSRGAAAPPELTRRERECLHWAAEGKTSWEVGQLLGVSERTAVFHLQNAARKLEVSGRQAAVARAVSMGLINPA